MTPPPPTSNPSDFGASMQVVMRQLERLEERTRDLITRADMENLRKELVSRDSLDLQIRALQSTMQRIERDRIEDKVELEKRLDEVEKEQVTRQDRLWMRLGQSIGLMAFIMALFEFLTHLRIIP